MRPTLAMLLVLLSAVPATPDDRIRWVTDWTAALEQAREEDRPILLYFTVPG